IFAICSKLQPQTQKEVCIVLVGKTEAGKSASALESRVSSNSLTKKLGTEQDHSVHLSLSAPAPHMFLVVIKLGRFTEEGQKNVEMIQRFFGDEASKYTMVVFTHGDLLDGDGVTIDNFLGENPSLGSLVFKCNGGYHVFNNKDRTHSRVTELLEKINNVVKVNGGSHYTTEIFQEAERVIEEEKNRILRENEEKIHREEEKLKKDKMKQEAHEKELKEENERILYCINLSNPLRSPPGLQEGAMGLANMYVSRKLPDSFKV
uniref:AIG1-type G domain-containing protein n=1 Tax=Oncorhynchus tshawytscha TaxID=74940 RepID=A0A8C8J8D5_ONCTS